MNKREIGAAYEEAAAVFLEKKGVRVLDTEEDLKNLPAGQGTVIIRSHGVSRHIYDILRERGVEIVDATCPFVKKIHRIVAEHSAAGDVVVIIGSPSHPEVEGIRGWGNADTVVIESEEEAERFFPPTPSSSAWAPRLFARNATASETFPSTSSTSATARRLPTCSTPLKPDSTRASSCSRHSPNVP